MKGSRLIVVVGLVVLAAMVGLFSARPWVLDRLELSLLDYRFRLRGEIAPQSPVALVAIDEKSVDRLGRWPWRRDVVARIIDRLVEAGVSVIGFDIVFSEPEIPPETTLLRDLQGAVTRGDVPPGIVDLLERSIEEADTDGRLAEAVARSERAVLGYFFRTTAAGDLPDREDLDRALKRIRRSRVAVTRLPPEGAARALSCTAVEDNIAPIQAGARRLGFFSSIPDPDGVVRRVPLVARCGDDLYVSLPLAVFEVLSGAKAMVLGDPSGIQEIRIGETSIPTDEGGRVIVDYRGPTGTFPTYSAVDVLTGEVGREELEGVAVLLGATEVGIGDHVPTPFARVFPGPEVHANVLENLLTGSVIRRHGGLLLAELAALVALGLFVVLVVPGVRSVLRGASLAASLLVLYLGVALWAFVARGTWVNVTYPVLTLVAVYMAVALTQSMTVEARARRIRRQFATYVPPEVVTEMIDHPDRFRLGTERRDLSILFTDIRGFTTIAEEIGPEDVSRLLNAYLTPLTRIVFESRGTLDKYIGDAVMAFWGAPLPVDNHPARAAASAIAMQRAVEHLRTTRDDLPGADRLRIGIGLHAGEVVVGNMGSELRFAYTLSGDGVNLCSRLEGLTKFYRVGILASADLVERLPSEFVSRELDTIRVKGKRQSVRIFELLGAPGEPDPGFLERFARGLLAYREGRWKEAEEAFLEVIALREGDDGPSSLLLERMERLGGAPGDDWDGTWNFEEK
jgi:adenylate cyclase